MKIRVRPRTDGLCLERLLRISRGHLTWHDTVEIFLHGKLVDHHNPLCGRKTLQFSPVLRGTVSAEIFELQPALIFSSDADASDSLKIFLG